MFFEAHLQSASYNFALPGWDYRIQDTRGTHPALGGGIGAGYRLRLGRDSHWSLQAQAGVGLYHLRYDRYVNHRGGAYTDSRSRTFFGLDNLALSLVYNFKTPQR